MTHKLLIRTTAAKFSAIANKTEYNDSLVFLSDTQQIWTNGTYYGLSAEDASTLADLQTLSLSYDKSTKQLSLTSTDGNVSTTLDASDFVVDGMLNDVELVNKGADNEAGHFIHFTWNTDSGNKEMYLDVEGLVDIYDGQNLLINTLATQGALSDIKKGTSVDTAIGILVKHLNEIEANNIKSVRENNGGDYITVTAEVDENQQLKLTPALVIKSMTDPDTIQGLAETTDVKNYVDGLFQWEELD